MDEEPYKFGFMYGNIACPTGIHNSHITNRAIIIIGESATRNRMGCYGYKLPTTPFMSNSELNWVICTDAKAIAPHTIEAVPFMLTSKHYDDDTTNNMESVVSIIELLNKSGYRTAHICNQYVSGNDNVLRRLFAPCEENLFLKSITHNLMTVDGDLLPIIDKRVADNTVNDILFIHLHGSHIFAKDRYPDKQFNVFESTNGNKHDIGYDNSILYTDYVIEEIRKIALNNQIDWILYVSDHGESPDSPMPRDLRSKDTYEIPFCFWFHPEFLKKHSDISEMIVNNRNASFTTDIVYEIICWLVGLEYEGFPYNRIPFFNTEYKQ